MATQTHFIIKGTAMSEDDLFSRVKELRAYARHSDRITSHQAADSVSHIRESQKIILELLKHYGPMFDEQIFVRIPFTNKMSPSGARTRRAELVALGQVVDTGRYERTKSNRKTVVWKAV